MAHTVVLEPEWQSLGSVRTGRLPSAPRAEPILGPLGHRFLFINMLSDLTCVCSTPQNEMRGCSPCEKAAFPALLASRVAISRVSVTVRPVC